MIYTHIDVARPHGGDAPTLTDESEIVVDWERGRVVWSMTPAVAEFYAHEISSSSDDDKGMFDDARALRTAVDAIGEYRP